MRSILGLCWFRGCKGLQPSRSGTTIGTFDQDLEGAGPSAAVLGDASFVLPQQGMRSILGLCWFRGKGLQPSRSGTTIGALIKTWRAPGPSAPWVTTSIPHQFALLLDLRPRRQRKTGAGHEE